MKFVHASDIHLDSPMLGLERYDGAPVEEIRGATRRALQNLVDLAVNEKVDFVLIAGDLYDGDWKDYNTGLFFVSQMARLRESRIKVIIVTGNHDAANQITRHLRMPDNVSILSVQQPESIILKSSDVAIHGQGFASRAVTDDLVAHYPKARPGLFNIGLLHTCLDGREGHEPYAPCSLDGLLSRGYQYWALGHVHKRETIRESPWVLFPGNTQGRNVRETGPKGCMLVSMDDSSVTDVAFKSLDVFRWSVNDVNVAGASELEEVLDVIENALKREVQMSENMPVALRIRLYGSLKIHGRILAHSEYLKNETRALASDMSNGNIWIEKVSVDTTGMADLKEIMMRDDVLGGLLRTIYDLQYDEQCLKDIFKELDDLFRKLPHEYLNDDEAIHPEHKETLARVMGDVKHMLLSRMASSGGAQ